KHLDSRKEQTQAGGKTERAGVVVRLRRDNHLVPAVPLHEQHLVTELAAGDAIDREVAEHRGGLQVGECIAEHRVVAAARGSERGGGQETGGVNLRGGLIGRIAGVGPRAGAISMESSHCEGPTIPSASSPKSDAKRCTPAATHPSTGMLRREA